MSEREAQQSRNEVCLTTVNSRKVHKAAHYRNRLGGVSAAQCAEEDRRLPARHALAGSHHQVRWLGHVGRWVTVTACMTLVIALPGCGTGSGSTNGRLHGGQHREALPPQRSVSLGVNTILDYGNQQAIALADAVNRGAGYRAIVSESSFGALLDRFDGAVVGDLHIDIVFTGMSQQTVRVTSIQIEPVESAAQALSGTYLPVAHQGGRSAYEFIANMDTRNPTLKRANSTGAEPSSSGQTFPDFNLQLKTGEQSTIGIDFRAARGRFKWFLKVGYLVGSHAYSLVVRAPRGLPFAVTGPARRYSVSYVDIPYVGLRLKSK